MRNRLHAIFVLLVLLSTINLPAEEEKPMLQLERVRQLMMAIHQYVADSEITQDDRPKAFPLNLEALVGYGYLRSEDFAMLVAGGEIQYTRPESSPLDGSVVLVKKCEDGTIIEGLWPEKSRKRKDD